MNRIRVITEFCETYKSAEDVANLLKKVSFQFIHKFIVNWKGIYEQFKERIAMFEKCEELKKKWKFEKKDYQTIFYELETFQKRCSNLE